MCELLGRRGGSHGNVVLGPRVLNGDGLRNKPKKKYISVQVCRVCVFGCVVMCLLCVFFIRYRHTTRRQEGTGNQLASWFLVALDDHSYLRKWVFTLFFTGFVSMCVHVCVCVWVCACVSISWRCGGICLLFEGRLVEFESLLRITFLCLVSSRRSNSLHHRSHQSTARVITEKGYTAAAPMRP